MRSLAETVQINAENAAAKRNLLRRPVAFLVSGALGGAYIGIGVVFMLCAAGPLSAAESGFTKLVSGLVFGVALTLVVFAGADLVTSAMMTVPQALLMRKLQFVSGCLLLSVVFICNLLGAALFSTIVHFSGVLQSNSGAGNMLAEMLAAKIDYTPIELFCRGILCNFLVCLAIWMAARATSETAKVALIFVAIAAFITSGFEHVVANMTSFMLGLLANIPGVTFADFGANLIWVGLGNLCGGALLVGFAYWFIAERLQK